MSARGSGLGPTRPAGGDALIDRQGRTTLIPGNHGERGWELGASNSGDRTEREGRAAVHGTDTGIGMPGGNRGEGSGEMGATKGSIHRSHPRGLGYTCRMKRRLLAVCLTVLAVGCASNATEEDLDAQSWAREVRIITPENVGDRDYDVLAELEERVRITAMGEEDAVSEAERRMRLRAARVDADAVVMAGCGRITDRDDFEARTTPTMRCLGYAIRWVTY